MPDDTIGHGIITHDGAPGAIKVDGFTTSTLAALVVPIMVVSARDN
ncbi:MAG: hypothetical protein ACR2QM_17655 [Longimicrobiales bacterium]